MTPNLLKLPDHRSRRIVCGTTVRKPLVILKAFLDSLEWQERDERTHFEFCFVPDFAPDQQDAQQYLFEWVNRHGGTLLQGAPVQGPDFSDAPSVDSHQWSASSMARVAYNKNQIIQFTLNSKADALWLTDADLIMDRTTFRSLDACEKPIVSATYWTRWSRTEAENRKIYAGPQVWLRHPYFLDGRGMEEFEFRQKLLARGVVRVWGFGACTLINRRVLEAGVDFSYLPDVSMSGLMGGEDRHFCIKCERMHIDAYADNWQDIAHVYHSAEDIAKIPAWTARLGAEHPRRAGMGDLVSVRLRPLEAVPVAPNRMQQVQPQLLRGRLGQIDVLPEIEAALLDMQRGDRRVIRAHFPVHHEMAFLRRRMRLIEITLLDCKPNSAPPVVEDDLFMIRGRWVEPHAMTADQQASLGEVHAS